MPYSPQNRGTEGQVDKLDFEKILWKGIDDMRKAMFAGDATLFANSLQALEVLLTVSANRSKKYTTAYEKLETEYKNALQKAGNSIPKQSIAKYNKLLAWSRAIMALIAEAGYMPERSGSYGKRTNNDDDDDTDDS